MTMRYGRTCTLGNCGPRRFNNLFNHVSQSYSTALVSLSMDDDGTLPYKPYHNVTVFNAQTGSPVQVPALSDQGNDVTLFQSEWAQKLGADLQNCTPLGVTGVGGTQAKEFCAVEMMIQIAPNLKPVKTIIAFGPTPKNLLGRESILGKYTVTYSPSSITYQETSSGFDNKQEAMMARVRNDGRVNSGRTFGANWRNRF